jgi:dephospho-CoA kinase
MILCVCGPSGSGKSTVARKMAEHGKWEIYTGKDYLRWGKNEPDAWKNFTRHIAQEEKKGIHIIIVLTETSMLEKVKGIGNVKIVRFTADEDVLLNRFMARMNADANPAFSKMIRGQCIKWEKSGIHDVVDTTGKEEDDVIEEIVRMTQRYVAGAESENYTAMKGEDK